MQRVILEVVVESVYLDTPLAILKRGLDYSYRGGKLHIHGHGFDCVSRSVAGARRVRRSIRSGRPPICLTERAVENTADVECDAVLDSARPPAPQEILLLVFSARLYRMIEDGALSVSSIARQYSTASCSLVEGGYLWYTLERLFGRKALRLSTARILAHDCSGVHTALVPVYRGGRVSVREARCYIGVSRCRSIYELLVPEELEPAEELRLFGVVQEEARRRLAEMLEAPYADRSGAVRIGAGVWPLTSIPAVAWLRGLASGEALETIFSAYRRCSGPRLWPPRRLEYLLYAGGRLEEPGVLRVNVLKEQVA